MIRAVLISIIACAVAVVAAGGWLVGAQALFGIYVTIERGLMAGVIAGFMVGIVVQQMGWL